MVKAFQCTESALQQEHLDNCIVALGIRQLDRCHGFVTAIFQVRFVLQQNLDVNAAAISRCHHQCGPAECIGGIYVGAGYEQDLEQFLVP